MRSGSESNPGRPERREARGLVGHVAFGSRDANSYAGYGWVSGRYDRPWPERPVFGTVRCMTSGRVRHKLKMKAYLATYGDADLRSAQRRRRRPSAR